MMDDLDTSLARLRAMPTDGRLAAMDGPVMRAVAQRRERAVVRRSLTLAGVVALVIGGAGSIPATVSARTASQPVMLGMSDYAPSRLLEP